MSRYLESLDAPTEFRWVFWKDDFLSIDKYKKYKDLLANQAYEKKFCELLASLYRHRNKMPFILTKEISNQEYKDFIYKGKTITSLR